MRKSSLSKYFIPDQHNSDDEAGRQSADPKSILKKSTNNNNVRPSSLGGHSQRTSFAQNQQQRKSLTWGKSKVLEFFKPQQQSASPEEEVKVSCRNRKARRNSNSIEQRKSHILQIKS